MGEEKLTLTIFEVLEKIERKKGEKKRKIFFLNWISTSFLLGKEKLLYVPEVTVFKQTES